VVSGASFSAADRERWWSTLGSEVFDLLIVGGGITGVGMALDAAGRGLAVALVDAGDIGGGTSSRSSRLVHGGLRYLETFDFDLVFEALRERRRLLELAPHLVNPIPFLYPVFAGDATGLAKLAAGMWLYETLSLFRSPRRHRIFGRAGALAAEPKLRSEGLRGGALYFDAQVDDARITLAIAQAAARTGAAVVTYAKVEALDLERDRIGEATVRDRLSGRTVLIRARLVVNATGPWSDRIRALSDPSVTRRLRTTKGAHILVPRDRVGNRGAVIFRSIVDGRVMFVLPWQDFTYIGTTDTEFTGDPGEALADADDVRYLLDSANGIFPRASLDESSIVSSWAGVRPLLAPDPREKLSASATSREHAIWRDPSGLLNIAGGKLTTYRSMAAEGTIHAARILREEFAVSSGEFYTEFLPLPGALQDGPETLVETLRLSSAGAEVPPAALQSLVSRYGADARQVLAIAENDAELATPIVPSRPYIRAEILHAVRTELALTLEDLFRRRIPLFYELQDGGVGVMPDLVALLATEDPARWTPERISAELEEYRESVRVNRAPLA
jgi:glycerol-3-phosphate dehydrogenase